MENLKNITKRDINSIPIGVIYISNPEFSTIVNFNYNQFYVRIIDTVLEQLSISNFYIVPIGLKLSTTETSQQTTYINTQLAKYHYISYFFCSLPTNYISILFEAYFKYNHQQILLSTGSSQFNINYQDNVFRFLQNDTPLINFIANFYLKEPLSFDLIYIPGEFINGLGTGRTNFFGFTDIVSNTAIINNYLTTIGKSMVNNPTILTQQPPSMTRAEFVNQMAATLSDPDYYLPGNNYFQTNIMQYLINPESSFNEEFRAKYDQSTLSVINWIVYDIWFNSGTQVPDFNRMSYIEILCIYILFFDYTQTKDMVFMITNYNFPSFLSALYYYLGLYAEFYNKPDVVSQFKTKARFILTNTNNLQQYTYPLFTDTQTDTLWYSSGKTWNDLLNYYSVSICIPRTDQSMYVLVEKLSRDLNMRSQGKYFDISLTPPILLTPVYNAVEFLFHFVQNGIDLGPFILTYFFNSKLLQYGDNVVFDSNMDNIYGVVVLTSFFNTGKAVINRTIRTEPYDRGSCDKNDPTYSNQTVSLVKITSPSLWQYAEQNNINAVKYTNKNSVIAFTIPEDHPFGCICPGKINKNTYDAEQPIYFKIDQENYYNQRIKTSCPNDSNWVGS
jgi:hypothetical protein